MNERDARPSMAVRGLAVALYWGSVAIGLLLPFAMQVGVDVVRRKMPLAGWFDGFWVYLFAQGSGLIALSLLGAAPFAIYAVCALIHLGTAPRHGALVTRRRRLALVLAFCAMVGVSAWGHLAILTARGSTAGIGLIFLPVYVLFAGLVAYGLGRLAGRRLRES